MVDTDRCARTRDHPLAGRGRLAPKKTMKELDGAVV
jgi:hypothetical protein